jgi:NAD(P)-dependent dehydrogenase (short-subunit alcohol dehydrogenase family)
MDLRGRTVLVTGASSGLGQHFARSVAGVGAAVIVAARRGALLDPLVDELRAAGAVAHAVPMDVTDETSVIAAYAAAQEAVGPIDTVVANAGVNLPGSALEIDIGDFDRMVAVNLRGVFLTAREGARRMIAQGSEASGRGRIVIVASIGANVVLPGVSGYCASKAGVVMLGRALAREWARKGINVNMLCPGYVGTDLNAGWFGSAGGQRQIAGFPRRRLMADSELDAALHLLCSDGAAAMTGATLTVDDGQTL